MSPVVHPKTAMRVAFFVFFFVFCFLFLIFNLININQQCAIFSSIEKEDTHTQTMI